MTERMVTNKNQASPGTSAVKTEQAEVPTSVYDQLLNDPDAYQAYLHTTKGTLSINPETKMDCQSRRCWTRNVLPICTTRILVESDQCLSPASEAPLSAG